MLTGRVSLEGKHTLADICPDTVEEAFERNADGDPGGLVDLYGAGFLLLRYRGTLSAGDRDVLVRVLTALLGWDGYDEVRDVVLPDLLAFGG